MRRQTEKRMRSAVCRIAAASLILGMAAPGTALADPKSETEENLAYKNEAKTQAYKNETETKTDLFEMNKPDTVSEAKAESEEHRPERVTISSVQDLEALAKRCILDTNSKDLEVVLTQDISLTGITYTPIPYFSGVFDGQNHTIRGIAIRSNGSNQALFRFTGEGAVIRNLNVEGMFEPGRDAQTIGGIVGDNAGTILNCSFRGSIRAKENGGGIVGINEKSGLISGCTFEGKAVCEHRVGGIAGLNSGSILSCTNLGEINNEYIETDEETKSTLTANLTNLSSFDVSSVSQEDFVDLMDIGGIAGYSEGLITDCKNTNVVGYAHTGYNVGGIVGRASGFTVNCTNEATINGRKDVGGIVGQLEPESIWEYSRSQMQELKGELNQLNDLLDTLAGDVADSSAQIRDDITSASGYADGTIQDLQVITNDVGGDIEKTSSALTESVSQLEKAVDENDAAALKSALAQLAQLVSGTDFLSRPVNVTVQGNTQSDLSSLLDAREADWWQKLDQYLNSRERNSGQQFVPDSQSQSQTDSTGADSPALIDADGADAGASDTDYTGIDSPDAGLFGGESDDQTGSGFSDPAAQVPSQDGTPDESWNDDAIVPDDGQAGLIVEDSSMTGSEDAIIEEDAEGTPVLNIDTDLNRNYSVGDSGVADSSRDSNIQVGVDANLPDTAQLRSLLQAVLTDTSLLLDPAALSNAMEILKSLQMTPPDTESFYQNFQNLSSSVVPIASDASNLAGKAATDIDAVTDQLDRILDTFFGLADSVSLEERYVETDVSGQDPYQSDASSIESCKNTGEVNGDTNVGGITGCIGFENKIDAEGVLDVSKYLLKDARYTIFASVRKCYNKGSVTAKKEAAGGIAGFMEFGIVTDCVNTGEVRVEEGDYCGGISGMSRGAITNCCAGSLLTGGAYTGGIAGKGTDITGCISYSYLDGGREYQGAIAGSADGTVSGCRYVDYGIGGIDNVGYTGVAEPMEYVPAQAGTVNTRQGESGDADEENLYAGNTCTITFLVDDEVFEEVRVPFGGSLETLPEVPNRGDDFWVWDEFDRERIFHSQTVTGTYHRATTTLASGGDVPDYLVEGVFYEGQELTVEDYVMEESPVSTESVADLIGEKIQEFHDSKETEAETEGSGENRSTSIDENSGKAQAKEPDGKLARAKQEVERIITDRLTGPLLDAKTLSVNDYDKDLTVRVKADSGGRLFTAPADGELEETDYRKDGSYIVFPLPNGGSFAYYESLRQNRDMRGKIALICGIAAAVLLVLILLIRKGRKKRKAAKAARKEENG